MSKGKEIYQWVCTQPCELKAVASLSLSDFRELGGWLGRRGEISGIPGKIWGVCMADGFRRIVAKDQPSRKKVEEVLG